MQKIGKSIPYLFYVLSLKYHLEFPMNLSSEVKQSYTRESMTSFCSPN